MAVRTTARPIVRPIVRKIVGGLGGLGPELVTNGTFASDTAWTKGSGWSISGGVAVRVPDASLTGISQSIPFIGGRTYRVTYTLTRGAGGFQTVITSGSGAGPVRTSGGTYTEDLVPTGDTSAISFNATSTFSGTLDLVSVRRVL